MTLSFSFFALISAIKCGTVSIPNHTQTVDFQAFTLSKHSIDSPVNAHLISWNDIYMMFSIGQRNPIYLHSLM